MIDAVAMTRPKRHLCVIGDSETVSRGSPFLKRWMKFLEDNADLRVSEPIHIRTQNIDRDHSYLSATILGC